MNKKGDLRVWWKPQVPCASFYVSVKDIWTAHKILEVLADYDLWQLDHNIKPDFSNAGGLEIYDGKEWEEWEEPETGQQIDEYMNDVLCSESDRVNAR